MKQSSNTKSGAWRRHKKLNETGTVKLDSLGVLSCGAESSYSTSKMASLDVQDVSKSTKGKTYS
jgi:hypothetical protein